MPSDQKLMFKYCSTSASFALPDQIILSLFMLGLSFVTKVKYNLIVINFSSFQDAIEQFAVENLNEHRKGFLGKAVPIVNMLTWTKV